MALMRSRSNSTTPEQTPLLSGSRDSSRFGTPLTRRADSSRSSSLSLGEKDAKFARHTVLAVDEDEDEFVPHRERQQSVSKEREPGEAHPLLCAFLNHAGALLLSFIAMLVLIALASRVSTQLTDEQRTTLAEWRPLSSLWHTTAPDGSTALDPSKPVKHYKYAGPRTFPSRAKPFPLLSVLNHASPQETLHAQLKDGVRYLTTMAFGGHANQFIGIMRALYLAKITHRIGVIPTLIPIHIDGHPVPMSDFYDVDRFNSEAAGVRAVEMVDLKRMDVEYVRHGTTHNEELSCWSTQELTMAFPNGQLWSFDLHNIKLNHWALPPTLEHTATGQDISFEALKLFDGKKHARDEWIAKVRAEHLPQWSEPQREYLKKEGWTISDKAEGPENTKQGFDPVHTEPPTDQFMCFDNTLFVGPVLFEDAYPGDAIKEEIAPGEGPSWIEVGQHLHFNRELEALADAYLVDLFGCGDASRIPPFLSIHLRRGDFKDFTGFTDLDKYISALTRLRTRTQTRLDNPFAERGVFLNHFRHFGIKADEYAVVVTTDEQPGTEFWREVEQMGWKVVNHDRMKTKASHGPWHMTMIDAAVLARGQGFVGTQSSTFSHLAGLRVKYWNGGLVEGA